MEIQAAVVNRKGDEFKIEPVKLAEPQQDEVLIQIVASGVCHTDAVARDMGLTPFPVVLGHEGSGIVQKVGPGVKNLKPGDHVVISFAFCGHCEQCLKAHPTVCERFNELNMGGRMENGQTPLSQEKKPISNFFGQSSFGTYAIASEQNVVRVDKDVDLALLGPLGCGIQTGSGTVLNALKPEFGSSIVIFGSGAVGMSAIMASKIVGAKNIIGVDIHDHRLALAKELGATHTINSKQVKDVEGEIQKITGGGVEYAIDTTGVPTVVKQALHSLKPLGKLAIVGVTPKVEFDVQEEIMAEGKSIIGVVEGDSIPRIFIPQLIDYYKKGMFPFDRLIQFYPFNQINEAFEASKSGRVIKPILKMNQPATLTH